MSYWCIRERLNLLKLVPTRGALVLVRWHFHAPEVIVSKNASLLLEVKCREVRVLPRIERISMRLHRAIFAFLLVSLATVAPASANSLTGTTPVSGSILSIAPTSVTLTTEAPMASMGSEIKVTDPKGNRVDDGALTVDQNSANVGLLALTEKGIYQVEYSLITENDVPLTGIYTFTYNAPDKITTPKPTASKDSQVQSSSNFGTTIFVLLVGVAGLLVAGLLVLYGRKLYNER
jgi:copper resistance protein C